MTTAARRSACRLRRRPAAAVSDAARDLRASARDSGFVELRDSARQRHRVLPRAGVAAVPGGDSLASASRRRWRARARTSTRIRIWRRSRSARSRARSSTASRPSESSAFARRSAGRSAASATGWCGPAGCRSVRLRRSPSSDSGASAPVVVGFFLLVYNAGHLGLRAGGCARAGSTGCAWRRRSATRCFVVDRSTSDGWRRSPPVSRFRWRSAGSSARAHLLGGVLVAVAVGAFVLVRLQGRIEGWRLSLVRARCFRPLLGDSPNARTHRSDRQQDGLHARPAAEIVKLAAKFQSRDHDREGRSRGERQEHHGRDDAGRRYGSTHHAARRRARRRRRRSTRWRRSSATSSGRAEWTDEAHRHSRVARHRRRHRCICSAGRCPTCRSASFPTTRFRARSSASTTRSSGRRSGCVRFATASSSTAGAAGSGDLRRAALDPRRPRADRRVEELIQQNLARREGVRDRDVRVEAALRARAAHPMLRERVGDLKDVEIRVLTLLLDLPDHDPVDLPKGANAILVTHDLTPSLTVQLDRDAIAAIATDAGTRTSHVAILARSLGLPGDRRPAHGDAGADRAARRAILDGSTGLLAINPSHADIEAYRERARQEALAEAELSHLAALEAVTTDGVRITLRANVDLPEEAELGGDAAAPRASASCAPSSSSSAARRCPTRTSSTAPTRASSKRSAARRSSFARSTSAATSCPVGGFPTEPNPFLGWRAIRMCLDQPELFGVQLRALLRAAVHGDVRIMLPLIVTLDEVRQARELLEEAARELEARGAEFRARRSARRDDRDAGRGRRRATRSSTTSRSSASARTTSCSTRSRSIAATRTSRRASRRSIRPCLRLIQRTVDTARRSRLDVAVCGEMASQPLMAFALIGLGVRQLSVAPRSVPLVKRIVRGDLASHARRGGGDCRAGRRRRRARLRTLATSSAKRRSHGCCTRISALKRRCGRGRRSRRPSHTFRSTEAFVYDRHLFTSESVTEGHPDKVADAISDAVLDAILTDDPEARVACETLVTTGLACVAGEITTRPTSTSGDRARDDRAHRLHRRRRTASTRKTCAVISTIDRQSPDIAMGVDTGGAGDQGMMFGYATDETDELMPMPIVLAHRLTRGARRAPQARRHRVAAARRQSAGHGRLRGQTAGRRRHRGRLDAARARRIARKIRDTIIEQVIEPAIPAELRDAKMKYHINPTGRFVIGGPQGDAGLTGRKIIVDTYGGMGRHGGGAFSGKDPSKVDRSACYAARWVAKNIVAAKLARRCEVQLAYAIGVAEPVSVTVDTFGTATVPKARSCARCTRSSTSRRTASLQRSTCASRSTARRRPTGISAASPSGGQGSVVAHGIHLGEDRPCRRAGARRSLI